MWMVVNQIDNVLVNIDSIVGIVLLWGDQMTFLGGQWSDIVTDFSFEILIFAIIMNKSACYV